jgi:hypothetical protein
MFSETVENMKLGVIAIMHMMVKMLKPLISSYQKRHFESNLKKYKVVKTYL